MLNIAWTEIMVVAAIALIVVGPKDLPVMLRQLGKMFGTVRRMGNEFKTEINKVAALDEVKDIKKSITSPLEDTHAELTDQFNAIGKDGVEPSGAIKPAIDGQESVADEIRESAGMKTKSTATHDPKAAADSMKNAIAKAQKDQAEKKAAAAAAATTSAKKPATRRKPAAKKPATAKTSTAKTTRAKSTASKADSKPGAKKPAAKRTATTKTAAKPAAAKRTGANSTTTKAAATKTTAKPKRAPRKKPAAASKDA